MQRFIDSILVSSASGMRPLGNAQVTVYEKGTSNLAVIYSDNGFTQQDNPFLSDTEGGISFYAADGRYDIRIAHPLYPTSWVRDVLLMDVIDDGFVRENDLGELAYQSTLGVTDSASIHLSGGGSGVDPLTASVVLSDDPENLIELTGGGLYADDQAVRTDLSSTDPGKGASMVGRGVIAVASIADLLALPESERREDLRYLVRGYYAGTDVGGGEFYLKDGDWHRANATPSFLNSGVKADDDSTTDAAQDLISQGVGVWQSNLSMLVGQALNPPSGTRIIGNGLKISNFQERSSVINHLPTTPPASDTTYFGVGFAQEKDSPISGGMDNNHAMVKWRGGENNKSLFNTFDGQYGISFGGGDRTQDDRRIKFSKAVGNHGHEIQGMFIENIGASYSSLVGNSAHSEDGASYHGIRLAGYSESGGDDNTAECIGVVASANVFVGLARGIAAQNTASYFSIGQQYIEKANVGVQMFPATSELNRPQMGRVEFVGRDLGRAITGGGYSHCKFDVIADGSSATGDFIDEGTPSGSNVPGKNVFSGIIRNALGGRGAIIRSSHNTIDLTIDATQGAGLVIVGGYNSGKATVLNAGGSGVLISGDHNNLTLVVSNSGNNDVQISGTGNSIHIVCEGDVVVGGSENMVSGVVQGSILNNGTNNDLSGIKGGSGRGQFIGETDSNGKVIIPLNNHPDIFPSGFVCNIQSLSDNWHTRLQQITGEGAHVVVLDSGGNPVTETSVIIRWNY